MTQRELLAPVTVERLSAAIRKFGRHIDPCALVISHQQARRRHMDSHGGPDDWESGQPECGDAICAAWALAGAGGTPSCACGFSEVLAGLPQENRDS